MEFVLNNSVLIIALITASLVIASEYKSYVKRKNLDPVELRSLLRRKLQEISTELAIKTVVAVLISIVISAVSFKELWTIEVFHIVFLTSILSKPIQGYLKRLL